MNNRNFSFTQKISFNLKIEIYWGSLNTIQYTIYFGMMYNVHCTIWNTWCVYTIQGSFGLVKVNFYEKTRATEPFGHLQYYYLSMFSSYSTSVPWETQCTLCLTVPSACINAEHTVCQLWAL